MMVGAGLAAAGAGAYYLLGPKAKEHQKKAKALMEKMKKEVTREIKKVKKVTPPLYHKAVDAVLKNYAKQYKLHEKDIKAFGKILKDEWNTVSSKTAKTVKKSKSLAKKMRKK
jgi:hypothetical protein